jgi:hypothetical protein
MKKKVLVIPPVKADKAADAKAQKLHTEILASVRTAMASTKKPLVKIASLLTKMKESELWQRVKDPTHAQGFSDFQSYKQAVIASFGQSRFYEILSTHELTQGKSPVSDSDIEKMGLKKAAEVAKLNPEQRTKEIVELATKAPLAKVKQRVREVLNKHLPQDLKKEYTVSFVRSMTPSIVARYEALEANGVWLEGICDHDPTMTAKQKLLLAVIVNFEATHGEQLLQAEQKRLAAEEAARSAKTTESAPKKKATSGKSKTIESEPVTQKASTAAVGAESASVFPSYETEDQSRNPRR